MFEKILASCDNCSDAGWILIGYWQDCHLDVTANVHEKLPYMVICCLQTGDIKTLPTRTLHSGGQILPSV